MTLPMLRGASVYAWFACIGFPACQRVDEQRFEDTAKPDPDDHTGASNTQSTIPDDDEKTNIEPECSPFSDICPPNQRCAAVWLDRSIHTYRCTDITDELVAGESCPPIEVGFDPCIQGFACIFEEFDQSGRCTQLCENDECPDGELCIENGELNVDSCAAYCDPLHSDCPIPTQCRHKGEQFVCSLVPESAIGRSGDPCEIEGDDACASHHICVTGALVTDCTVLDCCTRLCDPREDACANEGEECIPLDANEIHPGIEALGVCLKAQ